MVESNIQPGRELRCFSLPKVMLNHPSSWLWYGRRVQKPPFASLTRKLSSAKQAPPPGGAGNGIACSISGCGKLFPDTDALAHHALEHLRLIRPWTSVFIHAGELTLNEFRQYSGCCEACGEVWPARRFLAEHAMGGGNACQPASVIGARTLYSRCCALRDGTERSLPVVSVKATGQPMIRVEWWYYPPGLLMSSTDTAYVLSNVEVPVPPTTGTDLSVPTAVYRPLPLADVYRMMGEVKAVHMDPRPIPIQAQMPAGQPPEQQPVRPPPVDTPQAGPAVFEFLLVSPPPFPARQETRTNVTQPVETKTTVLWDDMTDDGDESNFDSDGPAWSDAEDGE
ncbi:PR domain zinc finger protein 15 [Madurella fahalii]|uniref:PR domain zinc finger protein 15 n=1 Tax=Madurella fahalii TaxID=1157608 RepID=A0ABQ0G2Z6_9PEZI